MLRRDCPQKGAGELLPSFGNLEGGTDEIWAALAKTDREVEAEAERMGKRVEIQVTVVGRLQTRAKRLHLGPCDRKSWGLPGYGRFGVFPAQIIIESFRDIEVRVNPQSSYDYANMYHGLPYEAVFQGHCCPKQGQE